MISIFICDDDEWICKENENHVRKVCKKHKIESLIKQFHSGESLLQYLEMHPSDVEIILLDVLMDGMDGIETAKKLRKATCDAEIIFLTSSEEYVFDAFEARALHYLIKGSGDAERFEKTILKAVNIAKRKKRDVFAFDVQGEKYQISYTSILYFRSSLRTVEIYYGEHVKEFTSTMKDLENEMREKGFVRVHRCYLVNVKHIYEILRDKIILTSGEEIALGAMYVEPLKEYFQSYMFQGM